MPNPSQFIMEFDAPFNFGMTVNDWDVLFHKKGFEELKPQTDPCDWTDLQKETVEIRAAYWINKWNEWCKEQARVAQSG